MRYDENVTVFAGSGAAYAGTAYSGAVDFDAGAVATNGT